MKTYHRVTLPPASDKDDPWCRLYAKNFDYLPLCLATTVGSFEHKNILSSYKSIVRKAKQIVVKVVTPENG